MNKNKLRTLYDNIGLPRIIIFLFLIILCICMPILKLQTTSLLAQAVTRIFMNMVLVLAMVPSIECGIGMNYGLPLGVLCGLFGGMISMELGLSGAACFFLAMALGILLACGVGYGYAQLLNRVAGQESMITTYVGFSSVSLMCMVWMLLPGKKTDAQTQEGGGSFSLEDTERRMEELLGRMDGVGRVQVMLTLHSGETLSLAEDSSATLGSGGDVRQDSQVLTVNRGSGKQEVVVTRRLYPTYQGAVVVCQGAGDSRVRLRVLETVSVLTGLSSDKISVVQWKQ